MGISTQLLKEYLSTVDEDKQQCFSKKLKGICERFKEHTKSEMGFGCHVDSLPDDAVSLVRRYIDVSFLGNSEFLIQSCFILQKAKGNIMLRAFWDECLSLGLSNEKGREFFQNVFFLSAFSVFTLTLSPNYSMNLGNDLEKDIYHLKSSIKSSDEESIRLLTLVLSKFSEMENVNAIRKEMLPHASIKFTITDLKVNELSNRAIFLYLQKQAEDTEDKMKSLESIAKDLQEDINAARRERSAFVANLITVASLTLSIFTLINLQVELISRPLNLPRTVLVILATVFSITLLSYLTSLFVRGNEGLSLIHI